MPRCATRCVNEGPSRPATCRPRSSTDAGTPATVTPVTVMCGTSTGFCPGCRVTASVACTAATCTSPAMSMSAAAASTCTTTAEPVVVTLLTDALDPMRTAAADPAIADAEPAEVVAWLPAAPATATADPGATTSGPEPSDWWSVVAVACGRRG